MVSRDGLMSENACLGPMSGFLLAGLYQHI